MPGSDMPIKPAYLVLIVLIVGAVLLVGSMGTTGTRTMTEGGHNEPSFTGGAAMDRFKNEQTARDPEPRRPREYISEPQKEGGGMLGLHLPALMKTYKGPRMFNPLDALNSTSPPNKPSPKLTTADAKAVAATRKFYGGGGDPSHVGGFVFNDTEGYEPYLWSFMKNELHIRSVLDVGCGLGISSNWFRTHKLDTHCVEGSSEAVVKSLVKDITTEHDFSQGPWWPEKWYDAVWVIEFIEHIDEEFIPNYMATFMKARYIFASHSVWGGWHHVAVNPPWWWIEKFREFGFEYAPELTKFCKQLCPMVGPMWPPDGRRGNTHFGFRGFVFRNLNYRGDYNLAVTPYDGEHRVRRDEEDWIAHYTDYLDRDYIPGSKF